MSKLNKFFPYGLVDSRIINNRLCVTIFENQTAGIKSNDILVEKNEEYQLILDIRSDLSTKKYLICVDENKNQIGSRQYLEKDGKYDFRFFFDRDGMINFLILIEDPYPNEEFFITTFKLFEKNYSAKVIENKPKETNRIRAKNKILIIVNQIPELNYKSSYAYYFARFCKVNNIPYVLLYLDNSAVSLNKNIDKEDIGNILVSRVVKYDKLFTENTIGECQINIYLKIKKNILQILETVPTVIFGFDGLSSMVGKYMFSSVKNITIQNDALDRTSKFFTDYLWPIYNVENKIGNYKTIESNYPVFFGSSLTDYTKKNDVLCFDTIKVSSKISIIECNINDPILEIEKKIATSKILLLNKNNYLNHLFLKMANYYYTTVFVEKKLDISEFILDEFKININSKNISKKIIRQLGKTSDIFKYYQDDSVKLLNKIISKECRKNTNIIVMSNGSIKNDSKTFKMIKLLSCLSKFNNINAVGIVNNICDIEQNLNIYQCENFDQYGFMNIQKNLDTPDIIIFDDLSYYYEAKKCFTEGKFVYYCDNEMVDDINIFKRIEYIIPENSNIENFLIDIDIKNITEPYDLSLLSMNLDITKEDIYDIGFMINEDILEKNKELILEKINNADYDDKKILLLCDKDYQLQKKCSHPDLVIRITDKFYSQLELFSSCKTILIFGIDNTFSTLGFSLLELNKDIICSDTMSIYNLKIDKINKNDSSNTLVQLFEYINFKKDEVDIINKNSVVYFETDDLYEENNENIEFEYEELNDRSLLDELELEYFDLFLSLETITETNTFNYVILKNVNKNIKIDLSKVTKFQRNVNIWLINNINHISKFKNGKKYYFSDKPNIYDNKILNKKTLSYLYLTKPPKNKSLTNYKYVIYEKNNPIQFLFPESQIINMEQI